MLTFAEKFAVQFCLKSWPEDFDFNEILELVENDDPSTTRRPCNRSDPNLADMMADLAEQLAHDLNAEYSPTKSDLLERCTMVRLVGHGKDFISPLFPGFVHTALEHYCEGVLQDDPATWPAGSFVSYEHWAGIARETLDILKAQ